MRGFFVYRNKHSQAVSLQLRNFQLDHRDKFFCQGRATFDRARGSIGVDEHIPPARAVGRAASVGGFYDDGES